MLNNTEGINMKPNTDHEGAPALSSPYALIGTTRSEQSLKYRWQN